MIPYPNHDLWADNETTRALERELEVQAEAAKQAIREYKRTISGEPVSAARHLEQQRDVSRAVGRYIQLRRKLDELQTDTTRAS